MGDLLVDGVLLLFMFLGIRRGFLKEALNIVAVLGAILLALRLSPDLAPKVVERFGLSAEAAFVAAGVALWVVGFLVLQAGGRLVIARLKRAPTDEGSVAAAARGAFAALVRLLDAALGGVLGLAKGIAYCGIVLYAANDLGIQAVQEHFEGSIASSVYKEHVAPALETLPEVKVARSVGKMTHMGRVLRAHPDRLPRLIEHPEVALLRSYPPLVAAVKDPELLQAAQERDIDALLRHREVLDLLTDRELIRRIADVDMNRIIADIELDGPPQWLFPKPPSFDPQGRFAKGEEVVGTVTHLMPFGAVLELEDGTQGLVRTEDLSWTRLHAEPGDALALGQQVHAVVLATAPETPRPALGVKQRSDDPWGDFIPSIYQQGMRYEGPVTRELEGAVCVLLDDFIDGVLVQAGLPEGMRPEVGDRLRVVISRVDPQERVIWLELDRSR